jgi:Ca2+/Na+ antiporter
VAGLVSPTYVAVVVLPLTAAYALALSVPRRWLAHVHPLLGGLPENLTEVLYEEAHDRPIVTHQSWMPVLLLPLALAAVVGGSYAMVHEALAAQSFIHLSSAVLGTVVLAALTSLPNLWVALHFARTNRGTALMSAAMNSNTINLLGGLVIPALFIGTGFARGSLAYFGWLLDLTLLAVLAPMLRQRLSRTAGAAIIALYLIFAGLRVAGI